MTVTMTSSAHPGIGLGIAEQPVQQRSDMTSRMLEDHRRTRAAGAVTTSSVRLTGTGVLAW